MPFWSPKLRGLVRAALAILITTVVMGGGVVTASALIDEDPGPAAAAAARPNFKLPFVCGQAWSLRTYLGHNPDDKKLDMYNESGQTEGSAVVASAGGTVHQWFEPGGIEINHGDGWFTVYLHMSSRASVGTTVAEGDWVGTVGSVGTDVAHLHYEQLYDSNGNGDGETDEMAYPVIQGTEYRLNPGDEFPVVTSENACDGGGDGKYFVDTFADAEGFADENGSDAQGVLYAGTNYVYCKVWGAEVREGADFNHWWLRTDLDETYPGGDGTGAYISAFWLSRWGNDEAKDNSGKEIPDC